MPDNNDSYTNYAHGDLGDVEPGYDPDFVYPHLDPEDNPDPLVASRWEYIILGKIDQ